LLVAVVNPAMCLPVIFGGSGDQSIDKLIGNRTAAGHGSSSG
jgi:hypothetical protein